MSNVSTTQILKDQKDFTLPNRRLRSRSGILSLAEFKRLVRSLPRTAMEINSIGIQQACPKNLPTLLKIEEAAWPEESRASEEMLKSRIQIFPEGVLCASFRGAMVGFACLQILAEKLDQIRGDWAALTDGGFIRGTHTPEGSTLFGVSLSVIPRAPSGTTFALCEAAKKLTIRKKLPWVALGSRIPRYRHFADKMDVKTYIYKFRNGRHIDPELDLYKRVGMIPIKVLPDYFPDEASCNYGVLLAWKNPFLELQDQLTLWDELLWFKLWENKKRWREKPWPTIM